MTCICVTININLWWEEMIHENNINAHINFGLLHGLQNVPINSLQYNFRWHWSASDIILRSMVKLYRKEGAFLSIWVLITHMNSSIKFHTQKTARSIQTFDFSTLYTNLPLGVIYDSLRSLIITLFVNNKSVAIMVNSNRTKNILIEWVKLCGVYIIDYWQIA